MKATASASKSAETRTVWSASKRSRASSGTSTKPRRAPATALISSYVEAALLEQVAEPFGQERRQVRALRVRFRNERHARLGEIRQALARLGAHLPEVDQRAEAGQLGQVHEDLEEPVRLAAQAERIARAGRPLASGEQRNEGVDLVGGGKGRPGDRRGAQLPA